MTDIFDLLGDAPKSKKPSNDDKSENGDLDFLGSFKKKVKKGEYRSKKRDMAPGVTPLDMADLPESQRAIMFTMLRDSDAKSKGLTAGDLSERMDSGENLQDSLAQLASENWLTVQGDPPDERYRVNLRRKKGRLNDLLSALED